MKEILRKWLFKEEIERVEWYITMKKDELDRNYQDRANYLEVKYRKKPVVMSDEMVSDIAKELVLVWSKRIYTNPNEIALDSAKAALEVVVEKLCK